MKKFTALLTAVIILMTLTACGISPAGDKPSPTQTAADAVPGGDYSYTPRFIELGGVENYLVLRCAADKGFYATAGVMISNTIPAGVTPEYETQFYEYEQRLYFIGLDGAVRRLRSYSPIKLDEEQAEKAQYTQSTNIAAMLFDDGGALTVLEAVDEGWYEKKVSATGKETLGDYYAAQRWFIRTIDERDGRELSRQEIALEKGEWLDVYSPVTDGGGNIVAVDRAGIRGIDTKGKTLWRTASDEAAGDVLKTGSGLICVLSWGEGWSVRTLDTATGTLSGSIPLPADVYSVYPGDGNELLYNKGDSLYAIDVTTGGSRELLRWLGCDINAETISRLAMLDNGDIAGVLTEYDEESGSYLTELFILERGSGTDKTAVGLSLGTAAMSSKLRSLVIAYNRRGDGKRIEIVDYSGYEDAAARLTADILAGDAPDIIDLTDLDMSALAAEGVLEDLYPYIDADGELDRGDYFENLLRSCQYGDALVCTCPGFYISAVVGARDVVGAEPGWTCAEFESAAGGMDADCSIMEYYTTRSEVLTECVALCFAELVDTASGTCDFETELFTEILRFAAYFPEKYDWSSFTGASDDSTYFRLRTGRQLLTRVNIYSPEDVFSCDAGFDGGAGFVGYPLAVGAGNGLVREPGLAIFAGGDNKDQAWGFIRKFFTESYQRDFWGIPGMKRLYEEELAEAMVTNYYTDGEGEPVPISRADFGDEDREGDTRQSFYAVTEEQAQRLEQLISGTVRTPVYNGDILKLVRDKTTAYFAGKLSAGQAAAAVQGAVSEYLSAN